jgi:hypothetical protein
MRDYEGRLGEPIEWRAGEREYFAELHAGAEAVSD